MINTQIRTRKVKKYLVGALIGAVSLLGGCGKETTSVELPITAETREQINQTYRGLEEEANKVRYQFNEYIKDGYFSLEEQERIYNAYGKVEEAYDLRSAQMPESHKSLYSLIGQNLFWQDYGTTELEKNFRNQNAQVAVEKYVSFWDFFLPFSITVLGAALLSCVGKKLGMNGH